VNHLRRELAPISDAAWEEIDSEAGRSLRNFLPARRLVDFEGPLGWDATCVATGRCDPLTAPSDGVEALTRRTRPLVELRAQFTLERRELDAVDRGAQDPDLSPLIEAAKRIALAEDTLVFNGSDPAGMQGIMSASPGAVLPISTDYGEFPSLVASAVARLRSQGVDGPYGVALGPRCYTGVIETTQHGGYPVLEHLHLITGGPVVWAPAVDGSVVMSLRGGDYRLVVGQDLSIGYLSHDAERVTLYFEESLTFSNDTPEAAVALRYA
jgi:uncharacterized linocin/CFP29 family protein